MPIGVYLTLLFFDAILVGRLHVHFLIILVLLEILVVRAAVIPLWIVIHTVIAIVIVVPAATLLRSSIILIGERNLLFRLHLLGMLLILRSVSLLRVAVAAAQHLHPGVGELAGAELALLRIRRETGVAGVHVRPRRKHVLLIALAEKIVLLLLLPTIVLLTLEAGAPHILLLLLAVARRPLATTVHIAAAAIIVLLLTILFESVVCGWVLPRIRIRRLVILLPVRVIHHEIVVLRYIFLETVMLT